MGINERIRLIAMQPHGKVLQSASVQVDSKPARSSRECMQCQTKYNTTPHHTTYASANANAKQTTPRSVVHVLASNRLEAKKLQEDTDILSLTAIQAKATERIVTLPFPQYQDSKPTTLTQPNAFEHRALTLSCQTFAYFPGLHNITHLPASPVRWCGRYPLVPQHNNKRRGRLNNRGSLHFPNLPYFPSDSPNLPGP
jgi:hypothetical protein